MQFDLSEFALKCVAPSNKLIYDDKGIPSVMVYVPKFKMKDVIAGGSDSVHPAFIVNGQEVAGIWISKYQNVVNNGRGYSHPGVPPAHSMTWDTARGYCESKGQGWHMMSKAEWGALLLWCVKNGFLPWGNNNYGKDSRETNYFGIPCTYEADGRIRHILTGTGPITYSHNKQIDGIWDLNGNVSEWTAGIRTVCGELQFLPNNNAADSNNPQTVASTAWKALDAATGEFITPDGSGTTAGSVKVNCGDSNKPVFSSTITTRSADFGGNLYLLKSDETVGDKAKEYLVAMGLLPATQGSNDIYDGDYLWFNNTEAATERLFYCGGNYSSGASAGVGFSYGYYARAGAGTGIGFRSAYYEVG